MRYSVQFKGVLASDDKWITVARAFTTKGARDLWWRLVNLPHNRYDDSYIYRIYDNWRKAPVEL